MTTARAAASSASSKCGRRHHEETRLGIEVALVSALDGFIMSSTDLGRKSGWHRGTLGPAANSATPQGRAPTRALPSQPMLTRDARMNSDVAG